ncbi:MAG: glycerol-3-phosphate acyltransferase [Chloroflexi bacterium]|nr:glycerol-3-phosphate acyltransferase [Chloroflexota bacterium]
MIAEFILLIAGAYILGAVPASQVAAKLYKGIDLKKFGTGNIGVSNLARATSTWVAVPVIIFDFGKGMAPVYLAKQLGMGPYQQVVMGLASIVGHNWPIFLNFSGGRGVLTSLGVGLVLEPRLAAIATAIALAFVLFRETALGVLVATAALPVISLILSSPLTVDAKIAVTLGFLFIFLLIVFRRLTAPLSPLATTTKIKRRELLLNRFLFDRDIRSRSTWVKSSSPPDLVSQMSDEEDKTIK